MPESPRNPLLPPDLLEPLRQEPIRSPHNRTLKDIRRLRRCKGDHAVLEGPHLVREALRAALPLERVLATPDFLAAMTGSELALPRAIPIVLVAPTALASVTDADSPQGILAVALLPRRGTEALPVAHGSTYIFLEGVQDPGNVGALARVAEATGCCGLALAPGCAHPNHPRALRASAGSLLRLHLGLDVSADSLAVHLAALDPQWTALTPHQGTSLWNAPLDGTLILALGGEGPGLSSELLARCGERLRIPMEAGLESLNVAVAGAVVLFERYRRQQQLL